MGNNIDVFRPGFSITADVLSAVTAISFAKDSPSLRGRARRLGGGKTLCSVHGYCIYRDGNGNAI